MAKVALEFDGDVVAVDLAALDWLSSPGIENIAPTFSDLDRDLFLPVRAGQPVRDDLENDRGVVAITTLFEDADDTPTDATEPMLRYAAFSAPLLDDGLEAQDFTTTYDATEQVDLDLKGTIVLDDPGSGSNPISVTIAVDYGILTVTAGTSGADVADSGTGSVTITGTLAQIQALLDGDPTSTITYLADTDTPPASAEISTSIDDGGGVPIVDTTTIAIAAINDAPAIDLDVAEPGNDAAAAYTEGDTLLLAPLAVLADDNDSYDGAVLTIAFDSGGSGDDQLTVNSIGTGLGEIAVTGTTISYEGTDVATISGGEDGAPLIITFNADACHCAVQTVMANILLQISSDTPDTIQRDVSFTLVDGGGTDLGGSDTGSAHVLVDVTATNDGPVATAPLTDYAATEQVALDLKSTGLSVADPDAGTGEVTVVLGVDYGVLHVEAGGTSVVITDNDSWEVTLTGTIDEINALLGGDATSVVTYTADDDFPPSSTTLTLDIYDGGNSGDGGEQSGGTTANIVITPINDAPELDLDFFEPGNDAVATFVEGDPPAFLAFYATFDDDNADWDGATMTIAITGATTGDQLTIDDFGTGPGELGLDGANVTYEGDVVGTWSGGVNGDPLVITFNADACACAIELLAASVLYENIDDLTAASSRTVTFTFVDGAGGDDTTSATVALDVLPYAEILTGPDATGNEDTAIALTGIVVDGVAADPATSMVTVTLAVEHGTLDIRTDVAGGIDGSAITGGADGSDTITITATQDQINATLSAANGLLYLGDQDYNGPDELDISASAVSSGGPIAFTEFPPLVLGVPATAIAFPDLDGDSLADLIFGLDGGIVAFSNTLAGSFATPSGAPSAFAFGDFDGDGALDIGFSSYDAAGAGYVGYVSSLTGDTETIAAVPYAMDLLAADLNGDGLTDLVVADADNGRIGVILQSAPGVFLPPAYSTTTSQFTGAITIGDVNGDGFMDLLAGNVGTLPGMASPGSVDVLLGNGDGTFGSATQVLAGASHVTDMVVGDFDGDGDLDIAFSSVADPSDPSSISGVQVALGNGDGTFAAAIGYTTTASGAPAQIVAGDLNGDGFIDLVVTNGDDPGTISILAGNGDGTFQAPVNLDSDGQPGGIALGDPDGDGDLDIVVANLLDGTITTYNNDSIGGPGGVSAVLGITVDPVDDAAVAVDDTGIAVLENATVTIDVLANDTDVDSPAPVLATVNGDVLANPGDFTILASGAKVTLNVDGTLSYDPNGRFNTLISTATAGATGALNTSAVDGFTYTLAGGDTGSVSVTVNGADSATDRLAGGAGNDVITARTAADLYMLQDGGTDSASGGAGSDGFYFGAELDASDSVDGGVGGDDQVGLQGDYAGANAFTFGAGNLVDIETLAILSGNVTTFGDTAGNLYSYDITTVDANVAAGKMLTVNANALQAGESLTFNGAAETNGSFMFYGGLGADSLTGGQGSDTFFFGADGRFTAADHVDGQNGADDVLGLRGDYSSGVVFQASTMTNIETLAFMSATDARFAPPGTSFDYAVTLDDANVGAGKTLTISANNLRAGEDVVFDGSAETDGAFRFMMGSGNDTLIGGANADQFYGRLGQDVMTGGGGNDTFYFRAVAESTTSAMDQITDFNAGDHIDLSVIDASTLGSGNNAFAFIGGDAFNSVAGELRVTGAGTNWTVQADIDGDGIADLSIAVTTLSGYSFTSADFIL
jgi:Ca2+-binding RTX toxin-like protein